MTFKLNDFIGKLFPENDIPEVQSSSSGFSEGNLQMTDNK